MMFCGIVADWTYTNCLQYNKQSYNMLIYNILFFSLSPPKGQVTGSNPVGVTSFPYVDRILPWTGALRCWLSCSHRA